VKKPNKKIKIEPQEAAPVDVPDDAPDENKRAQDKEDNSRGADLSGNEEVKKFLLDVYADIEKGFQDQAQRADDMMDYWDIYNTKLTGKQFYNGNSQIFVPICHDAVNARKTRFTNQIFPVSGRYVEATTSDGTIPHATIALSEHYVRKAKLRTKVMPALMKNGDVEGQYTVYVSWETRKRHVVRKVKKQVEVEEGLTGVDDYDDIEEKAIETGYPAVEVIADSDFLVLPAVSDDINEAIEAGGSVTVIRRWGKAKIKKLMAAGEIDKDCGQALIDEMSQETAAAQPNKAKKMTEAAGIYGSEGAKFALVYETWLLVETDDGERICRAYFGGADKVLGCKRNPYWCDRLPIISAPVEKIQGAFKGQSKLKPCADMQYLANDACNEGMDSAAYALMPIVMTDPLKNPRVGSMILALAAVWETSPQDTQFAKFPELWKDALQLVAQAKSQIMQTLGVNPASITQQASGDKKLTQAEIASEQQVDLLTTADAVTVVEEGILTPMIGLFIEFDAQFRDKEIMVRQYGEMGQRAVMEEIPPLQFDTHYEFRWFGVEAARNAQQIQQQIAGMNVLRGIPPEQMGGYKMNLVPIITQLVENTYGPRLAPLIFESPEQQMPVPVDQENNMLMLGYAVPTHEMDDDQAHLQSHGQLLQQMEQAGDAKNKQKILAHMFIHMQQMAKKAQAQAQPQQGAPGMPGGAMGGQPQPGVAGTPRIGAQPMMPRGGQGPPGMIHHDQLKDPAVAPRI
jgi:hypothetical protein